MVFAPLSLLQIKIEISEYLINLIIPFFLENCNDLSESFRDIELSIKWMIMECNRVKYKKARLIDDLAGAMVESKMEF